MTGNRRPIGRLCCFCYRFLPWQRVINSQGKVSPRRNGDGDLIQRLLLEAEGVRFDALGRVALVCYGEEAALSEDASG